MIKRLLLAITILLALPDPGSAQDRQCVFSASGRMTQDVIAGDTIVTIYDPFTVTCTDGAFLQANSGELNRRIRELHLVGDVFFQDSIQSLTSDEAIYSSALARLYATGNVVFSNREDGSTLEGPELEYFRATEERPLSQVTARQRPTLRMRQQGDEPDAEPLNLVADEVLIIGEDDLTATGNVVITRTDLDATSGEARYNTETEDLELRRNAVIRNPDYELAGDVIQAQMTEGALEHVHARTDASLVGEDLTVSAPDLQLFFADTLLERAVAKVPPGESDVRARALSRTFRLEADSLDANFQEQTLELVHAVGSARGETIDTLGTVAAAPDAVPADDAGDDPGPGADDGAEPGSEIPAAPSDVLAQDWIMGDTITGYFARAASPPEEADTAEATTAEDGDDPPPVELQRLVAIGSAQSLYRMTPEGQPRAEGPGARRNVNFLVGERIELELSEGELSVANVQGLQQGVYLEATPVSDPDEQVEDVTDDSAADPITTDETLPIAGDDDA